MGTRHLLILILFLCPLLASAELAPSVYESMQSQAPEFLNIEVLRVDVEPGQAPDTQTVRVMALVNDVQRSASGVKRGDVINIVYPFTTRPKGWVGPGEIPIAEEKDQSVAYLKKDPETSDFVPVAGAMSFRNF